VSTAGWVLFPESKSLSSSISGEAGTTYPVSASASSAVAASFFVAGCVLLRRRSPSTPSPQRPSRLLTPVHELRVSPPSTFYICY
jgi:hypothetical protein